MTELKELILQLCKRGEGMTQAKLAEELASRGISQQQMVPALNQLLGDQEISTFQRAVPGGEEGREELVFRAVASEDRERLQGLTNDDMSVLQAVRNARDRGIWSREIKFKTGLQQTLVTKALKTLETRKIIKSVRAVSNKGHKLYMLYDVEPSREVTGGAWYSDAELDEELVRVLQQQCNAYIMTRSFCSAAQVHKFIAESGVFKVDLKVEDVVTVLNALAYDGTIEEIPDIRMAGKTLWKPAKCSVPRNALTAVPCATCPVADVCNPTGLVNPRDCPYLTDWLAGTQPAPPAPAAAAAPTAMQL